MAFQLQTRLAPRRAGFVPPGDRPWAARRLRTRPGDVVVSAFPQTPAVGDLAGFCGAARQLHVADGKVAIVGKELKACSETERCGSQRLSRPVSRGPRAASAVGENAGRSSQLAPPAGCRGGGKLLLPTASSLGSASASLLLNLLGGISFCLKLNSEPGVGYECNGGDKEDLGLWGTSFSYCSLPSPRKRSERRRRARECAGQPRRRRAWGKGIAGGGSVQKPRGHSVGRIARAFSASSCPRPCRFRTHRRR